MRFLLGLLLLAAVPAHAQVFGKVLWDQPMSTPLFDAVARGDDGRVAALLDAGADVNLNTNQCNTEFNSGSSILLGFWGGPPLAIAAGQGRLETTRLLLKRGAKVNARDANGATALFYAVRSQNSDIVTLLLASGADPNIATNSKGTPLEKAVIYRETDAVRALLEAGARTDEPRGHEPLAQALANGSRDIALLLLEHGADINGAGRDHLNPLIGAVSGNMPDLVQLLLARGVQVNTWDDNGCTPLENIVAKDNTNYPQSFRETQLGIKEMLLKAGAKHYGRTDLMDAVCAGEFEKTRELVARGADVNERAANGEGALSCAVSHPDILKWLLQHKAQVNIRNYRGETPLIWALDSGQAHGALVLLAYGANPNAKAFYGETALMRALQYPDLVRALLQRGANPRPVNNEGKSALDQARRMGRPEVVALLERALTTKGRTAPTVKLASSDEKMLSSRAVGRVACVPDSVGARRRFERARRAGQSPVANDVAFRVGDAIARQ